MEKILQSENSTHRRLFYQLPNFLFVLFQKSVQSSPQQSKRPGHRVGGGAGGMGGGGYLWKMSCLRPAPPTRSYIMPDGRKNNASKKKGEENTQYYLSTL
jgi:hypothetical protein